MLWSPFRKENGSMHSLLFGMKRADQCSRALQRGLLASFGITPARYDMLFVIFQVRVYKRFRCIFQSHLRRQLGVTAPTTSKMARALERLGFITRKRERYGDRRQILIELTEKGVSLLRRVRKEVIDPGILWLALYTALSKSEESMGSLAFFIQKFRAGCRDPARFYFPDERERRIPSST
jgi:DNA-binding MarR family transcriptional regulator